MASHRNMKTASGRGETGKTTNHTVQVYKMTRRPETKLEEKENHGEFVEKRTILRNLKCFLNSLQKRNGRPRKDLECAILV